MKTIIAGLHRMRPQSRAQSANATSPLRMMHKKSSQQTRRRRTHNNDPIGKQ